LAPSDPNDDPAQTHPQKAEHQRNTVERAGFLHNLAAANARKVPIEIIRKWHAVPALQSVLASEGRAKLSRDLIVVEAFDRRDTRSGSPYVRRVRSW
jgi:hypothetical protein